MGTVYLITLPIIRTITRLKAEAATKAASLHPEHPIP